MSEALLDQLERLELEHLIWGDGPEKEKIGLAAFFERFVEKSALLTLPPVSETNNS